MRIFIGSFGQKQQEEECVNHIKASCHGRIDITFLRFNTRSGWTNKLWRQPYECLRYTIPELCSYKGKAIYLDVGCAVKADLRDALKEFNQQVGWQHAIAFRGEFAVIDCTKFDVLEWPKIEKMKRLGWPDSSYLSLMAQLGLNCFGTQSMWLDEPPGSEASKVIRNAIEFKVRRG